MLEGGNKTFLWWIHQINLCSTALTRLKVWRDRFRITIIKNPQTGSIGEEIERRGWASTKINVSLLCCSNKVKWSGFGREKVEAETWRVHVLTSKLAISIAHRTAGGLLNLNMSAPEAGSKSDERDVEGRERKKSSYERRNKRGREEEKEVFTSLPSLVQAFPVAFACTR